MADDMDVEASGSSSAPRRTRHRDVKPSQQVNGDSDADEEQEEEDDSTPASAKRRRTRGPTDSDEEVKVNVEAVETRRNIPRDVDGFVTGSIVRVKCIDFMTYEAVEFNLGPKLNMVVGPNGSGKSSIVCAIAIGLGFSPKVLERASNVAEFIRRGQTSSTIEIELKGYPGQRNVVVRREMEAKKPIPRGGIPSGSKQYNVTTNWYLDGQESTQKAVQSKINKLGVDLTNLCSFLPQDRVGEFSGMNDQELLLRTQEAAGNKDLSIWHQDLIVQKRDLVQDSQRLAEKQETLKAKEDTMCGLEQAVARYEERRTLEQNLAVIDIAIPFSQYQEAKKEYDDLRIVKQNAEAAFAQAREEHAPFVATKDMLKKRVAKLEPASKAIQSRFNGTEGDIRARKKKIDDHEVKLEKIRTAIEEVDGQEKTRKKKIQQYERKVNELKAKLEGVEPPIADTSHLDTQLNEHNRTSRQLTRELQEANEEKRTLLEQGHALHGQLRQAEDGLARVNNVASSRDLNYKRLEPEGWAVTEWIRANRHELQFGCNDPVSLAIEIPDFARYGKIIESILPDHALKMILAKSRPDYDHIRYQLIGSREKKDQLHFNMAEISREETMADYQAPFDRQRLNDLGFDCWAIDCIRAPDEILIFLCKSHNLHRIPIAGDASRVNTREVERQDSGVRRYVAGDQMHTIGFSSYGQRESYTISRFLKPNNYLRSGVDPQRLADAQRYVADVQQRQELLKAQGTDLDEQIFNLRTKSDEVKEVVQGIQAQKQELQKAYKDFKTAQTDLEMTRNRLAEAEAEPTGDVQREKLGRDLRAAAVKRMADATAFRALHVRLVEIQQDHIKWHFESMQAKSDLDNLESSANERETALREKEQAAEQARQEMAEQKSRAVKLYESARQTLEASSPDVHAAYQSFITEKGVQPADDLETQAQEMRDTLHLTAEVAGGVLQNFEDRKKEIEKLQNEITKGAKSKEAKQKSVNTLKAKWEPAIKELIAGISVAFSTSLKEMGVQGEVKVLENADDYAKWGVNIVCAFRDTDDLQTLTGSRQSGGERSLATISYLMALTKLANAPFTVVDEINQGMDPRVEADMHNRLVRATCETDANQYFLITPKLLTNLRYHADMRVLCICNGPWVPEEFSIADSLRKKRAELAGR